MAAVFFDIDGTLWDQRMKIPESTVRAIDLLKKNGHSAFLCSGRPRSMIFEDTLFALPMDGILAGCGTWIEYQGHVLQSYELDRELLKNTVDLLQSLHLSVLIEAGDALYIDEGSRKNPYGAYLWKALQGHIFSLEESREDWHGSKLTILTFGHDYSSALPELSKDYAVLAHGTGLMELVPKGFSKASGIKTICEFLHIPHEETYAIGDSVNDCDMLTYAHTGIAMGNADMKAKKAADYVTEDIHEDGLYHALSHFCLI